MNYRFFKRLLMRYPQTCISLCLDNEYLFLMNQKTRIIYLTEHIESSNCLAYKIIHPSILRLICPD